MTIDDILKDCENLSEFERSIIEAKFNNLCELLNILDYDMYKDIILNGDDKGFIKQLMLFISE